MKNCLGTKIIFTQKIIKSNNNFILTNLSYFDDFYTQLRIPYVVIF